MFNHLFSGQFLLCASCHGIAGTHTKERSAKLIVGMHFPRRAGSITTSVYNLPGYFRWTYSKVCPSGDNIHSHTKNTAPEKLVFVLQNPHSV